MKIPPEIGGIFIFGRINRKRNLRNGFQVRLNRFGYDWGKMPELYKLN